LGDRRAASNHIVRDSVEKELKSRDDGKRQKEAKQSGNEGAENAGRIRLPDASGVGGTRRDVAGMAA
jgi:hypothetical protein